MENRFKHRREELKLTQREVAEAIDRDPKLTPAMVSAWEGNVAAPSSDVWEDLAKIYRKPMAWVAEGVREIGLNRRERKQAAAAS